MSWLKHLPKAGDLWLILAVGKGFKYDEYYAAIVIEFPVRVNKFNNSYQHARILGPHGEGTVTEGFMFKRLSQR
jgi:hypothetical protein